MNSGLQINENCSLFSPRSPHFFKIILQYTIEAKKLMIPRRFVRKYGNSLTNPVYLKVPSGAEWKVGLLRCDGEVWFQKGWEEFADYYSVDHWDFLIFRYEGNSRFSVILCDGTATEIDYPVGSSQDLRLKKPKMEETQDEDDDISVEFLGEEPAVSRPSKMMRTGSAARKVNRTAKPQAQPQVAFKRLNTNKDTRKERSLGCPSKKFKGGRGASQSQKWHGYKGARKREAVSEIDGTKALERAKAFRSKHPFFLISLKPSSCIPPGCRLSIPQWFTNKYLKGSSPRDIILSVPDGYGRSTWHAKIFRYDEGKGSKRARIRTGWTAFAREINLKAGDACAFELINRIKVKFRVSVYRA